MSTALLPVAKRVNADTQRLGEPHLRESNKTPQHGNVLARLEITIPETFSNSRRNWPGELRCGQLWHVGYFHRSMYALYSLCSRFVAKRALITSTPDAKSSQASSNETPCFFWFARSLASSQETFTPVV